MTEVSAEIFSSYFSSFNQSRWLSFQTFLHVPHKFSSSLPGLWAPRLLGLTGLSHCHLLPLLSGHHPPGAHLYWSVNRTPGLTFRPHWPLYLTCAHFLLLRPMALPVATLSRISPHWIPKVFLSTRHKLPLYNPLQVTIASHRIFPLFFWKPLSAQNNFNLQKSCKE